MTEKISNIRLSFQCPADLSVMQDVEGGKFCTICQKKVHDFTNSKADYFRQVMAENGNNICGRFLPSQMATSYVAQPLWRKWVSAAMILLGFNFIHEKAVAQDVKKTDKVAACDTSAANAVFGGIDEILPEYPGGQKGFTDFVASNLKRIKGASGKRAFATFVVNENGTLSNIKIMKGINPEADAELVRVLKLSPKWKPGIRNAKAVKVQYSIPVEFK